MKPNPKGAPTRVLLTSVFGPYAQDDEFGSRTINPMELYHNPVTRAQGAFFPRMFHRSWGIMTIQSNVSAPCAALDFPTRAAFARELTSTSTTWWAFHRSLSMSHGARDVAAWCGSFPRIPSSSSAAT